MEIGHSHRPAVLLMYLWSLLISAAPWPWALIDGRTTVGLILLAALVLFLITAAPGARPDGGVTTEGHPEDPFGPGRDAPAH